MKFLVDQCVSYRTIKFLRSLGFKLTKLRDVDLPSLSDPDVLKLAIKRDEILLTEDNGFGNILQYPLNSHEGIIILRTRTRQRKELHLAIKSSLLNTKREELRRTLVIIDDKIVRIKRHKSE